jgi:hypothetical protein
MLSILFLSLPPDSAQANPGFARKFGASCILCHAGFPKLNQFGDDFAGNGFQMPGGGIASMAEKLGDPKLFLEKNMNLAARVDAFLRYRSDTDTRSDFETPFLAKLFITGYLANNVTFYTYFLADEGGEVVGLEDAFLYLNNLFGQDLDFQIGQFQVMDPVYSREQRLTYQDIEIYLVQPGDSQFELTYQRGGLLSFGKGPVDLVAGVVNGNGIGTENGDGNFDNNTPKDYFGRIGAGAGPVSIGYFGYKGLERDDGTGRLNSLSRHGPDLRIWYKKLDIRTEWLFGVDRNPDFAASAAPIRHSGGFAEIDYHFNTDWTGVILYNYVGSKKERVLEKNLATVNLTHYFLRNLKAFLEYTHDLQSKSSDHPHKAHSLTVAVVLAF